MKLYGDAAAAGAGSAKENPHHELQRGPVAASGSGTTKAGSHFASMSRHAFVRCRCGPLKLSLGVAPDNAPWNQELDDCNVEPKTRRRSHLRQVHVVSSARFGRQSGKIQTPNMEPSNQNKNTNMKIRMGNLGDSMGNLKNKMGHLEIRMGNLRNKMGNLKNRMGNLKITIGTLKIRMGT
jgi:hypothetical protein